MTPGAVSSSSLLFSLRVLVAVGQQVAAAVRGHEVLPLELLVDRAQIGGRGTEVDPARRGHEDASAGVVARMVERLFKRGPGGVLPGVLEAVDHEVDADPPAEHSEVGDGAGLEGAV